MRLSTYRCFLPDLTGFMKPHCARPNRQHHLPRPDPTGPVLKWEFDPAIADCEYRVPLPPRLARQNTNRLWVREGYLLPEPTVAERVGFEPTVESPLHCISSAACSSTPAPLHTHKAMLPQFHQLLLLGGEGGIRTHGAPRRPTVFETATFNRSVTSPVATNNLTAQLPEELLHDGPTLLFQNACSYFHPMVELFPSNEIEQRVNRTAFWIPGPIYKSR